MAVVPLNVASVQQEQEKVLPLASWILKFFYFFPVVLYIPDAIFNYYVYSDGWDVPQDNVLGAIGKTALVAFLSIGVVGMAYLLSVIAPWHWGNGHRIQAFFCGVGVLIATGITTWNSLSYRSTAFIEFPTDKWAYGFFPGLETNHVSITMILVSIAPPFWGLFWAIVQPTTTNRNVGQLQASHEERLLKLQHEAEVKQARAEANAKIREAQLKGMAKTAAVARNQAAEVLKRKKAEDTAKPNDPDSNVYPMLAPEDLQVTRPEHPVVVPTDSDPNLSTFSQTGAHGTMLRYGGGDTDPNLSISRSMNQDPNASRGSSKSGAAKLASRQKRRSEQVVS